MVADNFVIYAVVYNVLKQVIQVAPSSFRCCTAVKSSIIRGWHQETYKEIYLVCSRQIWECGMPKGPDSYWYLFTIRIGAFLFEFTFVWFLFFFQVCWIKLFFHCIAFVSLFWWKNISVWMWKGHQVFHVSLICIFDLFFDVNVWCQFKVFSTSRCPQSWVRTWSNCGLSNTPLLAWL